MCSHLPILGASLLALSTLVQVSAEDLSTIARNSISAHKNYTESSIHNGGVSTKPYGYGVPDDDFEFTASYENSVLSTGEAGGHDIFQAADPAAEFPGRGLVTSFDAGSAWTRLTNDKPQMVSGTFILGDHRTPYYLGERSGTVDNDFAYIVHFAAPETSHIVLHGSASDYQMVPITSGQRGTAIFYRKANGQHDLISFILDDTSITPSDSFFDYTDQTPAPRNTPSAGNGWDQLGGAGATLATAVKVSEDNSTYIVGVTREDLPGADGSGKLFAAKYSPNGQRLWLRQFGSDSGADNQDYAFELFVDDQHLYTTGRYFYGLNYGGGDDNDNSDTGDGGRFGGGRFGGGRFGGGRFGGGFGGGGFSKATKNKEMFVVKIALDDGAIVDEQEYGGLGVHFAGSITGDADPDNGFLYTAGIYTDGGVRPDPFLMKIKKSDLSEVTRNTDIADGMRELWGGLAYHNGTVYATGWTLGSADRSSGGRANGRDAWVGAFRASDCQKKWIAQWGARLQDWAWDVDTDANGQIYVVGHGYGPIVSESSRPGAPGRDDNEGHLVKISDLGQNYRIEWIKQIGTPEADSCRNISIQGNDLYISGHTFGSLGSDNRGKSDGWIGQFDLDGNQKKLLQFGTDQHDRAFVAAGPNRVVMAGFTQGSMVTPSGGWLDAFVIGFDRNLNILAGSTNTNN